MIKKCALFCLLVLTMSLTASVTPYIPRAKVTFKVIDCEGKPIANEPLMLGFSPTEGYDDETDKDGNLTEARYGKIYGPINFFAKETRQYSWKNDTCELEYYLNPNINDTNIECNGKSLVDPKNFDTGRNRYLSPYARDLAMFIRDYVNDVLLIRNERYAVGDYAKSHREIEAEKIFDDRVKNYIASIKQLSSLETLCHDLWRSDVPEDMPTGL